MALRIMFGLLAVTGGTLAIAQPPEGRDAPPPGRRDAIRIALDTNGDHQLDAEEIKNAATNLAKADRDGDGTIDHEEFRPPLPPGLRGEGGFRGPPPREGASPGRPPQESAGEDRPPRDAGGGDRPVREGRPLRDAAVRGEGGPTPERFVERAMTFDTDGDGKLDRGELEKFAGEVMQRLQAARAERGMAPGEARDGGFRPAAGLRRGPEGAERPERPRRPE